jgi:protein-tyrosine phosphatase
VIGHPIHHEAALVLEQLGGEPSDFTARQLTPKIASAADLVLTMTKTHRDTVLELAPHRLHSTFTLSEAARLVAEHHAQCVADLAVLRPHLGAHEASDVPDPIGHGADFYALVGAQIAELLAPILELCRRE